MSNRFEEDFSRISSPSAPAPIGPDGIQYYLEQGRRERAKVIRAGLRSGGAILLRALKATLDVMRRGTLGTANRAPERLTSSAADLPC